MDVNYWRLTPAVEQRLSTPLFPIERLGDLVTLVQYGSSALATSEPIGTPILRMNNLQDDGWDLSDLKYIELDDKDLDRYRLVPGDILFNRTNSKELVGKCEVFDEPGDWVFASYLIRVRTNSDLLLPQFASDFLSTRAGRLQIDRLSRQIIGMTNINGEEIRELKIPRPPLEYQQSLIASLDVARVTRAIKRAEADDLRQTLNEFVVETVGLEAPADDTRVVFAVPRRSIGKRLDPHFHSPLFDQINRVLAQTRCRRLGDIVEFSRETWKPSTSTSPTFRYVEISSVSAITGTATWRDLPVRDAPSRARMVLRSGDLIVSLTRPHHGSIALLDDEFDGCVASTGFAVIRDVDESIRRDYLWCILRSTMSLRQMLQRSSGGNYPAITEAELGNVIIPVPDEPVQEQIALEARRRHDTVRSLMADADIEWQQAKERFEADLLGHIAE